jgi:hypothetical protein
MSLLSAINTMYIIDYIQSYVKLCYFVFRVLCELVSYLGGLLWCR